MKRIIIYLVISCAFVYLYAQRNWQSFTNTKDMRQVVLYDNQLVLASSGGVEFFDIESKRYVKTLTNIDGLKGIDIRAIGKSNKELQFAVHNKGIDRYIDNDFRISLTEALGLSSLNINSIYNYDNLIFVSTINGMIVFENNENYPFPLFKNLYSAGNGLSSNYVNTVLIDNDKYLYIGTDNGFNKVHLDSLYLQNSWERYSLGHNVSINSIDKKDNNLVFGTSNGLYQVEVQNLNQANLYNLSFAQSNIVKVLFDDEKLFVVFGAWINNNSFFQGDSLNRAYALISNDSINLKYFGENQIFTNPITDIIYTDDFLYVTSRGDGLYEYDKTLDKWTNYQPDCINNSTISKITVDNSGNVWFADGAMRGYFVQGLMTGVSKLNTNTMHWSYYNVGNSNLHSNNIFSMAVGSDNKKWFGSWWTDPWDKGFSVLDDSNSNNPQWTFINRQSTNPSIYTETISELYSNNNKMFVASYDGGVNVFNNDLQLEHQFKPPIDYGYKITKIHKTDNLFLLGSYQRGITYWDSSDLPQTGGSFWKSTGVPELSNSFVYSIDSITDDYSTKVWFATSTGIFMMEKTYYETSFYKYYIDIKRRKFVDGAFQNETLYFVDEERLWSSEVTSPSCLLIDPFGRVWMGSENKGISMYDMYEDRFYNYRTSNSPLISDKITALAYQASTGYLFVGTDSGLSIVEIGKTEKTAKKLGNIAVWPNPFKPDSDKHLTIKNIDFDSMPIGKNECRIFDISGQLVVTLEENRFMEFSWDGRNEAGKNCASGVYYYLIKTEAGDSAKGKIILIR